MQKFLIFSLGLCLLALTACSERPPKNPVLRIETGEHTAEIMNIAILPEQHLLATGSADKTVRLWDMTNAHLLRTLRLPIEKGDEGKVYAVAISPDGQTVAVGGYTGTWDKASCCIYLFDRKNGELTGRITGLENVIKDLAFSPDGRLLAAGLGGGQGLRLYRKDGKKWPLYKEDRNYNGDLCRLSFAPRTAKQQEDRLLTSSFDGHLRLYVFKGKELSLEALVRTAGGKRPYGVAFSPDGKRIAAGYDDTPSVTVHQGTNLTQLYAADTQGINKGNLASVTWSSDGNRLYGAGRYLHKTIIICRWDKEGRGKRQELPSGVYQTISNMRSVAGGGVVYGSADTSWGMMDSQGHYEVEKRSIIDVREMGENFRLAADGRSVGFAYKYGGKEPANFSVDTLGFGTQVPLLAPKTKGLAIKHWKNNYHPTLDGLGLEIMQHEPSRSLAIAAKGKSFLLGTDWNLYSFTEDGLLRWRQEMLSVAWSVNISTDNRLAVAALGDGTIRWYRYSDGQLLLSFFPSRDQTHWIAWTPSGYYAASPGGEKLMGWHNNRGVDHAAEFFPASQFRKQFYRPDVVKNILITLDEQKALKKANTQR